MKISLAKQEKHENFLGNYSFLKKQIIFIYKARLSFKKKKFVGKTQAAFFLEIIYFSYSQKL